MNVHAKFILGEQKLRIRRPKLEMTSSTMAQLAAVLLTTPYLPRSVYNGLDIDSSVGLLPNDFQAWGGPISLTASCPTNELLIDE
jgi:hypothetical protein